MLLKELILEKISSYGYHVTLKQFLPEIAKSGLLPQMHSHYSNGPVIFYEPDEEEAMIYHDPPNTVLLRFPTNHYDGDMTYDGEYVLLENVKPSDIEYKDEGGWEKLTL